MLQGESPQAIEIPLRSIILLISILMIEIGIAITIFIKINKYWRKKNAKSHTNQISK